MAPLYFSPMDQARTHPAGTLFSKKVYREGEPPYVSSITTPISPQSTRRVVGGLLSKRQST